MGNTSSSASPAPPAIDMGVIDKLEARARAAEQRIEELERAMQPQAPTPLSSSSSDAVTAVYVSELQSLRGVLVEAEKEHEGLLAKVKELQEANAKLEYRVKHLKLNCT